MLKILKNKTNAIFCSLFIFFVNNSFSCFCCKKDKDKSTINQENQIEKTNDQEDSNIRKDKDKKDNDKDNFDINEIDLSNSIKIGNGSCNDVYKIQYKNKTVVFSKNKTNGKLYKRFNIDYIAKNTFYNFFFSENQPKIYNEYFCEFINGYNLGDKYNGNVIESVNEYNNENKNKIEIDDKIKNKLIIQDIIFRTGDQGSRNQIYITEDIGGKKIIKDVVFIDLDFDLYRYINDYFGENTISTLDKNIQLEIIKILDKNIDDFVNLLDKNIENSIDKNQKFIKYITSDGKYNFNVINTFDFPIIKIYENKRILQGTEKKIVENINYFNDFNECDKELIIEGKIIEFSKLKYENNKIYIKYKDNNNFEEINGIFTIFAKINNFEISNGSFYSIKNGKKIILPNIYINDKMINNENIEIIDYKTAKKETILIYLTYILEKIKLCIDSNYFNLVNDDLEKLKNKYEEYIKNFKN